MYVTFCISYFKNEKQFVVGGPDAKTDVDKKWPG